MRRKIKIGIFILQWIIYLPFVNAQWQQINGPLGGDIRCFAVSSNSIYAGTNYGIFQLPNNGSSWKKLNITWGLVFALAANDKTIIASTVDGLFLSIDNGENWKLLNNWFSENGNYFGVTALAIRGQKIFATRDNFHVLGSGKGGVFVSNDNGNSWSEINKGLSNTNVSQIIINETGMFVGTLSNNPDLKDGIFISTNEGESWRDVSNGLSLGAIRALTVKGTKIIASKDDGIFETTENGWRKVNNINGAVYALAGIGATIYAGAPGSGVFISMDDGINWKQSNNGLTNLYINAIAILGSKIFVGTRNGAFFSIDGGNNWKSINNGLTAIGFSFIVCGDNLLATNNTGIYLSSDNGNNWHKTTNIDISGFTKKGNAIFGAACWDGLYLSYNNGENWSKVNANGLNGICVAKIFVIGSTINGTANDGKLYTSSDNGINWKVQKSWTWGSINIMSSNGVNILVGNGGGKLFFNENASWHQVVGLADEFVINLGVSGPNYFASTYQGKVFLSVDNGENWIEVNKGLQEEKVTKFASNNSNIFAITKNHIYLYSIDGSTWKDISFNLPVKQNITLGVDSKFVYASVGGTIWRIALAEIIK